MRRMQWVRYALRRSIAAARIGGVGLGALVVALAVELAPGPGSAIPIEPGSSPDSRSEGRANPSAVAVEGAQGLALGFRPAPGGANGEGDSGAGAAPTLDAGAPAIPEPSALLVFTTGLLFGGWAWRARKSRH